MRILVTGGAGFIGSNLARHLLGLGHSVRILDNFSNGRRENLAGLEGDLEVLEGNIENAVDCEAACADGIDCVSHQAAYGSVPRSIQEPQLYSLANVHGFVNLCNAARKASIGRIAYASSSSVYGDVQDSPKREERTGRPLSPYAASKAANESFAHSFSAAYGLEMVGMRYFNVYGPRQNSQGPYAAVIPLFVEALLEGRRPTIFGDGEQSRDFTYVENVIQANVAAMTKPDITGSHVINIGCGGSTSVNRLFREIARSLDSKLEPQYAPPRQGDVRDSCADISMARELIGYDPRVELEEGLTRTVDWYRAA